MCCWLSLVRTCHITNVLWNEMSINSVDSFTCVTYESVALHSVYFDLNCKVLLLWLAFGIAAFGSSITGKRLLMECNCRKFIEPCLLNSVQPHLSHEVHALSIHIYMILYRVRNSLLAFHSMDITHISLGSFHVCALHFDQCIPWTLYTLNTHRQIRII